MEHRNWSSFLHRLDDDPPPLPSQRVCRGVLRHNLTGERLNWFAKSYLLMTSRRTTSLRMSQQRFGAPFRFSAYEEKVLWGDLADMFRLSFMFFQRSEIPCEKHCCNITSMESIWRAER